MSGKEEVRRSPQARLQDRIILHVANVDDVKTVAGLSRDLGSSRSSTSRAINRLKADGLVLKAERKWSLTEAGEAEEVRLRHRLSQRSFRVEKEIDRIAKFRRDYERTIGSAAIQHISSAMRSLPTIPPGFGNMGEIMKAQSFVPKEAYMTPEVSGFKAAMGNLSPDVSGLRAAVGNFSPDVSGLRAVVGNLSPDVSGLKAAVGNMTPSPVQLSFQVRPFFEAMRLVDSVGVANSAISSSLGAISEAVLADKSAVMDSISKVAATDSLRPAKVQSLTNTLDLLNTKLGENALASIQVRAVEDLYKRITLPIVPSETLQSLTSHVALASGDTVRQILEQADFGAFMKKYGLSSGASVDGGSVPSASLEDGLTASLGDGQSAALTDDSSVSSPEGVGSPKLLPDEIDMMVLTRNWEDLSEAVKLRYVAVATFIVLHIAFLAAQEDPDKYVYVRDLALALGGMAGVVTTCKQLEIFKEE